MSDTTVHTPKTFSLEIEKIAFQKRVTHLEAISIYCEQMGIEPVTTAKLLTNYLYVSFFFSIYNYFSCN